MIWTMCLRKRSRVRWEEDDEGCTGYKCYISLRCQFAAEMSNLLSVRNSVAMTLQNAKCFARHLHEGKREREIWKRSIVSYARLNRHNQCDRKEGRCASFARVAKITSCIVSPLKPCQSHKSSQELDLFVRILCFIAARRLCPSIPNPRCILTTT